MGVKAVIDKIQLDQLRSLTLHEWGQLLKPDLQMFSYREVYFGRYLKTLNFSFYSRDEAESLIERNAKIVLREKYFTNPTNDDIALEKNIVKYISSSMDSLIDVISFENEMLEKQRVLKFLPNYCIAFANGVYDFYNNEWLFKYEETDIGSIYYTPEYIITWFIGIHFEPLDVFNELPLKSLSVDDLLDVLSIDNTLSTKLIYNMAHDQTHTFSKTKFLHIAQVLGYLLTSRPIQKFVIVVGDGNNGKNGLFEGLLYRLIYPGISKAKLSEIETDEFITGTIGQYNHNICLENEDRTYPKSVNLKLLTGESQIEINKKGVQRYSTYFNSKFLFAINNIQNIKFGDTSDGFNRRINILELFYKWDPNGYYKQLGDYYDVKFSGDFMEFREDPKNFFYIYYIAMFGAIQAFKDRNTYEFVENSYKVEKYSTTESFANKLEISYERVLRYLKGNKERQEDFIFTKDRKNYKRFTKILYQFADDFDYDEVIQENEETGSKLTAYDEFLMDHDLVPMYVSISVLYDLIFGLTGDITKTNFTQTLKAFYRDGVQYMGASRSYLLMRFNYKTKTFLPFVEITKGGR